MANLTGPYLFRTPSGGGSGSGSGGINYASTYFDGSTVSGINTYNDGASPTPTNGEGGVVTGLSTTVVTSTPLRSRNQRFSKDGSNRQGMGWSWDFTVDRADYEGSRPIFISFRYDCSSGYVNNDLRLFVYDKDAGTLLNVLSLTGDGSVGASTTPTLYTGVFYPTSTSNDYRLIWHIAGTTSAAWDFDWIDLTVSPSSVVPGGIEATLPSETWTDSEANATTTAYLYRSGSKLFVVGRTAFTGAFAGTGFSVTIPAAYTPDTTTYANRSDANGIRYPVGRAYMVDSGTLVVTANVALREGTDLRFLFQDDGAAGVVEQNPTATTPFTWANGDYIMWAAEWIVSGWAASAALSTTETLLVSARARATGNAASASAGNPIIFPTESYDNLNCYSTSTGQFTAPRSGYYRVHGVVISPTAATSLSVYVNNSFNIFVGATDSNGEATFTGTVYAAQGQTIHLAPGGTLDVSDGVLCIEELPDFSIFSVYGVSEYQESKSAVQTAWPFSAGALGDLASLSLTPGEWWVDAAIEGFNNGAVTAGNLHVGISTTSGNSATGLNYGDNRVATYNVGTSGYGLIAQVNNFRVVLTSTTTYYLKGLYDTTITNFQYLGYKISARRVK